MCGQGSGEPKEQIVYPPKFFKSTLRTLIFLGLQLVSIDLTGVPKISSKIEKIKPNFTIIL